MFKRKPDKDDYIGYLKEMKEKVNELEKHPDEPVKEGTFSDRYEYTGPDTEQDALTLLTYMSVLLDFYFTQQDREWTFGQLLRMSADDILIWKEITKCVVNKKTRIKVSNIKYEDMGLRGIIEVFCVFAEGFMSIEVPDTYTRYCSGISQSAVFQLADHFNNQVLTPSQISSGADVLKLFVTKLLSTTLKG